MKGSGEKMKVVNIKKTILILTLVTSWVSVFGNEFDDEFSSELPIDVDGSYKRSSASDKIEKLRKQLERQNEEMVSKKIEDLRLENEKNMTKKLTAAFKGKLEGEPSSSSSVQNYVEKFYLIYS